MKSILSIVGVVLATIFNIGVSQEYTSMSNYTGSYGGGYSVYNYDNYSYSPGKLDITTTPSEGPDERDALRVAQAYAAAMWDEYVVDISYQDSRSGNDSWHYMVLTVNLEGHVTSVILDNKVILEKGEALLPGIPLPKDGMWNAYIYVDGVVDDEPKVTGNANYERLKNGDRVSILLRPLDVVKYIPTSLSSFPSIPDNVDQFDIRLVDEDGNWVGYYYPWLGGFVLWTDPSRSPFWASIMIQGYSGSFGSFLVDPLKQEQKKFKGASLDLSLFKGVHRFNLRNSAGWWSDNVSTDIDGVMKNAKGDTVKAKTFIVENKRRIPLEFSIYGNFVKAGDKLKLSAYYVYQDGIEEACPPSVVVAQHQDGQNFGYGNLVIRPTVSDSVSVMFVAEMISGEPLGESDFYLQQTGDWNPPVYSGEVVIDKDGFSDAGSSSLNDENTARDYSFTFEVSAKNGNVQIFPEDIETFVDGWTGSFHASQTVDSTAIEDSQGAFVINEGETETFTVVVTISNVTVSGQYRVGLDSVGSLKLQHSDFRTFYRTINSSGKG